MENGLGKSPATVKMSLKAVDATPESFEPYGQVIEPSPDTQRFGPHDAQLDLTHGIPRLYIMRLENQPLRFSSITHHASVTQCLGSIGGQTWYLGVAKPSMVVGSSAEDDKSVVKASCGYSYVAPRVEDVKVFRVTGPKFLKLNRGTWHAGPLFKEKVQDFYNLELSNTNAVDRFNHYFKKDGVTFLIDD